ncbi:hypothetical protein JK386_03515 [Nocardioides sp. zg-536]|uniref:Uncharacterized protein n=1 Tax=Nocardioides faecalis TaxID=2803858 RepID=A0A938Y2U7_9ACTN|nr:hypothetical protein [Nocardioides faecalis]MBM9458958.1 hypothetical protein [Nocardioides faecalis]QVI60354.1 hypothetical protein KG111_08775 [Nocardioides faecalis]
MTISIPQQHVHTVDVTEEALTYEAVKAVLGADPETLPVRTHAEHMARVGQDAWLAERLRELTTRHDSPVVPATPAAS